MFENQNVIVSSATNGRQAIEILAREPDLSMLLMDIMMPEIDGSRLRTLPILALTAKAMKGDRESA